MHGERDAPPRGLLDFVIAVFVVAMCAAIAVILSGCGQQAAPGQAAGPTAPATVLPAPADAVQAPDTLSLKMAQALGQVPRDALAYRALLIRTAHAVWGMDAPVAAFAAQVHQESGWRAQAVSQVGAQGMAQFMPATTRWIATLDPALADQQPFNPGWALRALVTYDHWLHQRTPTAYAPFDRMWVALRAYNGGLGHWQAEARVAGGTDRAAIDSACGRAKRAKVHCAENLGYPQRILVVLQPRYLAWGPSV